MTYSEWKDKYELFRGDMKGVWKPQNVMLEIMQEGLEILKRDAQVKELTQIERLFVIRGLINLKGKVYILLGELM